MSLSRHDSCSGLLQYKTCVAFFFSLLLCFSLTLILALFGLVSPKFASIWLLSGGSCLLAYCRLAYRLGTKPKKKYDTSACTCATAEDHSCLPAAFLKCLEILNPLQHSCAFTLVKKQGMVVRIGQWDQFS